MKLFTQDLLDFMFFLGIPESQVTEDAMFAENLRKWDAGSREEALQELSDVIENQPSNKLARVGRCFYRIQLDDNAGALEDYSHVMNSTVPDADAFYFRGAVRRIFLGDPHGALEDFERAYALDRRSIRALRSISTTRKVLGLKDDAAEILKEFSMRGEREPNDPWQYLNSADEKSDARDHKGAIEELTKALRQRPDDPLYLAYRARKKIRVEDFEGALSDFARTLVVAPTWDITYAERARFKVRLLDLQGALEDLDKAIELSPYQAGYYDSRAFVKSELGDDEGYEKDRRMYLKLR